MRILLSTKDNVIVNVKVIKNINMDIPEGFSYNPQTDFTDPVKRVYRENPIRDRMGMVSGILIVESEADPFSFLYKKVLDGKVVDNPDFDEASRDFKISCRKAELPICDEDEVLYQNITYDMVSATVDEGYYNRIKTAFATTGDMKSEDEGILEKTVDGLPDEVREQVIYTVAKYYTRKCTFPQDADSFDRPGVEHVNATKDVAIYWWRKLVGTKLEITAFSEIATIFYRAEQEDIAVSMYEDMLKSLGITEDIEKEIRLRMRFIGKGRVVYNNAVIAFSVRDYDGCLLFLKTFDEVSSGITEITLYKKVRELRGLCLTEQAKILVEAAQRSLYPERYGIMHECDYIRW